MTLANSSINDVAATIYPNTPKNPLRCDLPNPTVAAITAGGVSVIRADGVLCNSSSASAYTRGRFGLDGALYFTGSTSLLVARPGVYLAASWAISETYAGDVAVRAMNTVNFAAVPGGIAYGGFAPAGATPNASFNVFKRDPNSTAGGMLATITDKWNSGMMPMLSATKLALAESTADLSSLVGATPLSDNFHSYTSTATLASAGWVDASQTGSSIAWGSTGGGRLELTDVGGTFACASYPIAVVAGKTYRFDIAVGAVPTGGGYFHALVYPSFPTGGGPAGTSVAVSYGNQTVSGSFVASTTGTQYVNLWNLFSTAGTVVVNSVSVKVAVLDRSVAGNSPVVNGTITRTAVSANAEMASYGGFSTANFLEVPASSALDFGTGDWMFEAWINPGSVGLKPIACYGTGSGTTSGWSVWTSGGGALGMCLGNTQISAGVLVANVFARIAVGVRGGFAVMFINGVQVYRGSTAFSFSLTNATLRIGDLGNSSSLYNDAVISGNLGSIALPRIAAYAKTQDQEAATYAAELPLFQPGAKCLLLGSGSVNGVAYDSDTDQLAVATTVGTNLFRGLARVGYLQSTTATNLLAGSSLSSYFTAQAGTIVGAGVVGPASWGGGGAVSFTEDGTSTPHQVYGGSLTFSANAQVLGIPIKAGSRGWAVIVLATVSLYVNLTTGATASASNCTPLASVDLGNGYWLVQFIPGASVGSSVNVRTATGAGAYVGAGDNGASGPAIYVGRPMLRSGTTALTATSYADGLSANDNHKFVSYSDGILAVGTAAGVDAFLPSQALREKLTKRPPRSEYDPTRGIYRATTTDATPTVIARVPVPEGKAYRVRAIVSAVQYGPTATEKAVYTIEGFASRDSGGNVTVVPSSQAAGATISEVTTSMDCQLTADTTNQTLGVTGTGKASTTLSWTVDLLVLDAGLQMAA